MEVGDIPARLRALPSYAIALTATRASQLVAGRIADAGISKPTYAVLAAIEEFGPLSQAELGRRLGMDRKNVSDETVELQRAGLVKRGPDPADVRRNRLEITPAGRELLARLDTTFAEVQDQLFAGLGAADRAELARLLDLVLQQLSPLPAKIS